MNIKLLPLLLYVSMKIAAPADESCNTNALIKSDALADQKQLIITKSSDMSCTTTVYTDEDNDNPVMHAQRAFLLPLESSETIDILSKTMTQNAFIALKDEPAKRVKIHLRVSSISNNIGKLVDLRRYLMSKIRDAAVDMFAVQEIVERAALSESSSASETQNTTALIVRSQVPDIKEILTLVMNSSNTNIDPNILAKIKGPDMPNAQEMQEIMDDLALIRPAIVSDAVDNTSKEITKEKCKELRVASIRAHNKHIQLFAKKLNPYIELFYNRLSTQESLVREIESTVFTSITEHEIFMRIASYIAEGIVIDERTGKYCTLDIQSRKTLHLYSAAEDRFFNDLEDETLELRHDKNKRGFRITIMGLRYHIESLCEQLLQIHSINQNFITYNPTEDMLAYTALMYAREYEKIIYKISEHDIPSIYDVAKDHMQGQLLLCQKCLETYAATLTTTVEKIKYYYDLLEQIINRPVELDQAMTVHNDSAHFILMQQILTSINALYDDMSDEEEEQIDAIINEMTKTKFIYLKK